jgi:succinate-acetate transporter protein
MPQYADTPTGSGYKAEHRELRVANPDVLGLGTLALITAMLGCYYASFIITYGPFVRMAIGIVLIIGGIVEVLAGMWAFHRNTETTASIYTAYGGFLAVIGTLFLSTSLVLALTATGNLHLVLGLLFLCWTIFAFVLSLGVIRANSIVSITFLLLALAFLILAIGHLAYDNITLLRIGGWIAIICAITAWIDVAFNVLGIVENVQEDFKSVTSARHHIATAK